MSTTITHDDPRALATPGIHDRNAPSPASSAGADLSGDELLRYSRHLILREVGVDGQERLKRARVLLVGAGGLGSPVALYLAAAGVGTLGIVDFDIVDPTNLQRQLLYGTSDIGRSKIAAAADRLYDVNPHVRVDRHETRLTSANALALVAAYDVVVDGTDNFATRYLVNDACVLAGKPNVYGSIFRFDGQVSVFCTADGPCYRCLYPSPPAPGLVPSCAEGGVVGILPGIVGTLQAAEVLKVILGAGDPLVGRLLLVDVLGARQRSVRIRRDPDCPACGKRTIQELIDYDAFCGTFPQVLPTVPEVPPREAAQRIREEGALLLDVREAYEHAIARIPGARLVPLTTLTRIIDELDPTRPIFVHCKGGGRSAAAVRHLIDAGFTRVWNVAGGIMRWREEVDEDIPTY